MNPVVNRHVLASNTLPSELREVIDDVDTMGSAIKSSALNIRLFRLLCRTSMWFMRQLGNVMSRLMQPTVELFNRIGNRSFEVSSIISQISTRFWRRVLE